METQKTPLSRSWMPATITAAILALIGAGYFLLSSAKPAPNVTFTTLSGENVSMESLRGKVVMVNFWATSCTTCIAEMPEMVATYNKYKGENFDYVAVAMSYDPPNYVLNYAKTRNLPFKVALDVNGNVAKSFDDVKLTPTTYVINKKGNIIKRYVGQPNFAEVHQLLEEAIAA